MTDEFALFQPLFSRQEAVFVTGIYAPLPKLFALRRGFRPDFFDNSIEVQQCSASLNFFGYAKSGGLPGYLGES